MPDSAHDRALIDDLIRDLEQAPAGNRQLDLRIAYCLAALGGERIDVPRLLVDAGFSFDTVSQVLEDRAPHYTTSLDAPVAGERIVLVAKSEKQGDWVAVHRDRDGAEILAWGRSECLARRLAALKAIRKARGGEAEPSPDAARGAARERVERGLAQEPTSEGETAEETEAADWKVLF